MTNWKLFACALLTGACCGTTLTARGGSLPSGHVYAASVQQAARTLTGTVTDSHGEPLPGVSVSVKGTTLGTITDIDGKYTLKVHEGAELVFSFVGMQTQTVRFKGEPSLNIILRDDNVALDDVVVIGYGSKNRKSLTSSISSVKKEDIERMAPVSTNVQDLIGGGMLKGVLATQNSGEPGSSISINVRGVTSPYPNMQTGTNNNAPLYVIDGVPLFVEATSLNPLMNLSPNDIESIDVLKDASATAIYGSRGANGVIIVTTKDGRKDEKPVVEVGYSIAVANPVKEFKPLTTEEFLRYTDQNLRNAAIAYNNFEGYSAMFTPYMPSMALFSFDEYGQVVYEGLDMTRFNPDVQTDWVREVKNRNALTHQYNASVRGGSQRTNYSLSLNGSNEEGLYRNDSMETYGGRIALNTDLSDRVKLGGVMNYSETKRRSTSDGLGTASAEAKPWLVRPDIAVYDELGELNRIDTGLSAYGMDGVELTPSPVGLLERQTRHTSNQFLGNLFAEIELFRGLKFRTDFSMTHYTFQTSYYTPVEASVDMRGLGMPLEAMLSTSDSEYRTTSLNFRLDYSLNLQKHLFGAMLGYGAERSKNASETLAYQGFPTLNNIDAAREVISKIQTTTRSGLNSVYGRVNYSYDAKYLAELSMRADASSKFGPGNQWGYFPALSLGWLVSEEDFIRDKDTVSNLKLRLSLGQTGSTNVADFVYHQYYINGPLYGGQNSTVLNGTLPNRNIGWEKTSEVNVGVDFSFFNDRLYGSLDAYYRYTDGALAPSPHILEPGMANYWSNIVDMSNRGVEFSIGADVVRGKAFSWSTMLNLSHNHNRIESLNDALISTYMQDYFVVGEPMGVTRGYVVDHIIQSREEIDALNATAQQLYGRNYMDNTGVGDYLLKDLDGNGIFDATYDKTVIANPEPAIFGGWQNTFSYKNWSLSMLMQFSQGGTAVYNDLLMEVTQPYAGKSVSRELYGNFWTPENTDARYARMGDGIYNYNSTLNDRYVFSTSYLRMKNITLAYELPRSVAQRLHLGSASVYAVATNLFTVTDWPGIDPESAGTGTTAGTNYDSYPLSKTFSVGVKLSF